MINLGGKPSGRPWLHACFAPQKFPYPHPKLWLDMFLPQTTAYSIVSSRLDHCNAILCRAPLSSLNKQEKAQHNLARVVWKGSRLTIPGRYWRLVFTLAALYKTGLLTFKVRLSVPPPYLADLLQLRTSTRSLRSAGTSLLTVPWVLDDSPLVCGCTTSDTKSGTLRLRDTLST